jgi:hypothetical protein
MHITGSCVSLETLPKPASRITATIEQNSQARPVHAHLSIYRYTSEKQGVAVSRWLYYKYTCGNT